MTASFFPGRARFIPGSLLRLALAVALPVTAAVACQGQSRPPEYNGCLERAGSNTVQQGMCAQAELTRQDARLNRAYQALTAAYTHAASGNADNPQQASLRAEERAWLADRDQTCRLNRDTVDNVCLLRRESSRADELEARLRRQP